MPKTKVEQWRLLIRRRFNTMFGWTEIMARLLLLLLFGLTVADRTPPPNYPHNQYPNTSFTCDDKKSGGYYADLELGCQVFHVCVKMGEGEIQDFRFQCPNDTIFDQKTTICSNYWDVDCQSSLKYYNYNDEFLRIEETSTISNNDPNNEGLTNDYIDNTEPVIIDTGSNQHRFDSLQRKGKQIESRPPSNQVSPAPIDNTGEIIYSTSSSPIILSLGQTATSLSTTTTPKITTRRPNYYKLPNVGERVVSVSSTTSYEVGYSNTEKTLINSNSGGISTTISVPLRNPLYDFQTTSSRRGVTAAPSLKIIPESEIKDHINKEDEELDPYRNYDWKKEDSSGFTISTSTLKSPFETSFVTTNNRQRETKNIVIRSTTSRPRTTTIRSRNTSSRHKSTETPRSTISHINQGPRNNRRTRKRPSTPAPEHKAFSNFRYYKTAFGQSEEVFKRESSSNAEDSKSRKLFPNYRSYLRGTASNSTRYSKYG